MMGKRILQMVQLPQGMQGHAKSTSGARANSTIKGTESQNTHMAASAHPYALGAVVKTSGERVISWAD